MIFSNACLIVAVMATSAYAIDLGEPGSTIAGIIMMTDVKNALEWDVTQKNLEDTMGDETCNSLALGVNEYIKDADYFENIPVYKETMSPELTLFEEYYGTPDFLDQFVTAAFTNGKVDFKNNAADFSKLPGDTEGSGDCVGREEGVKKTLSYTGSYINMVQYMEEAVEDLRNGCVWIKDLYFEDGQENPSPCTDAVHAWEKAIASWSGSLEGGYGKTIQTPGSYGKGLMALAGKRCANYKTCGIGPDDSTDKGSPARVNVNVESLLSQGRVAVMNGMLPNVRRIISEIVKEITVSRIQGVMRYAYRTGKNKSLKDKEIAEGAAFAFGVLPAIWACNKKSALLVAANTDIGSERTSQLNGKSVNFQNVRLALECNYDCLGIRFDDVGELNDCSDEEGNKTLCFAKKADSPNICKTTNAEKKFRKKCKNIAPAGNKNKKWAKTRFGQIAQKRF